MADGVREFETTDGLSLCVPAPADTGAVLKMSAHFVDYPYVSSMIDPWVKRFETEIQPHL